MINFRLFFLCAVMSFGLALNAQDVIPSQLSQSPSIVNPALTGAFDGSVRALANYRSQVYEVLRGDQYNNVLVGVDFRRQLESEDYIGFGISGIRQVQGHPVQSDVQGALSFAYGKCLKKDSIWCQYLVIGGQYGITKKSLDLPDTVIDFVDLGFLYPDINVGLTYMSYLGERKSFHFGIAAYHLNTPNVSFNNDLVENLPLRMVVNGGVEWPLSDKLSLVASVLYFNQNRHHIYNVGACLRVATLQNRYIDFVQAGLYSRANLIEGSVDNNNVVFVSSLQIKAIMLGLSYDYNVSKLRVAGFPKAAFEISFIYILRGT